MSDPRPPEDGLWQEATPAAGDGPPDQGSEPDDEAGGAEPVNEDYPEFRAPGLEPSTTAQNETAAVDEWAVSPDDLLKDLAVPWAPAAPADEPAEPPVEPDAEEVPEPQVEPESGAERETGAEPEAGPQAEADAGPEADRVIEPELESEMDTGEAPGPVEAAQDLHAAPPAVVPVADGPPLRSATFSEPPAAAPAGADGLDSERLVPSRPWLRQGAQAWIGLGPGDTASVEAGDRVTPITVIGERVRDPRVAIVAPRDRARFEPGARIKPEETSTRGRAGLADEGTVLYRSTRARLAVVSGREREAVHARVDGTVTAVTPGGVAVLVSGWALDGVAGAGQPVHGRLRMGVGDPGDELRSAGLHVADAGSIVVAGARVDVETLTRARALGIHGVITGGIAGHDLRNFQQSEARQQAALHPLPPFAVFVLEGFGRRSLAGPPWDLLLAAAGMGVSIFPDPALLVFAPDADLVSVAPGTVRIVAGPGAGTVGRIDGAAVMHRFDEGVLLLAVPFFGGGRRSIVPLADLERFQ